MKHGFFRRTSLGLIMCAGSALAADGAMDLSFGMNGIARTGASDAGGYAALAISSTDGSIVTCSTRGRLSATFEDFYVARFSQDGLPDLAFGQAGSTTIDFDQHEDLCSGVAIQPDGLIVLAGTERIPQVFGFGWTRIAVARLDASGNLDPTFGAGTGKVIVEFGGRQSSAAAVALQADGKILVAGRARVGDSAQKVDFAVVRLLADGSLDTSFGVLGMATAGFHDDDSFDYGNDMAVDDEGRIVVVGIANGHAGIARFLPDGQLDTSFDGDGLSDFGSSAATFVLPTCVVLQGNGQIVFAGSDGHVALVRLDESGSPDAGFGEQGVATVPFDLTIPANESAQDLVRQSDGKLVLVGNARYGDSDWSSALAARVSPAGILDPTFGENGKAVFTFGLSEIDSQLFTAVGIANGRILAAGGAIVGDDEVSFDSVVVRLDNDRMFVDGFE